MMRASLVIVFLTFFLCGCVMAPTLTQEDFDSIPFGYEASKLEERFGAPYEVSFLANDVEQYRYIHRFDVNSETREQMEYLFKVRKGRVIDKQCKQKGSFFINPIY